MKTKIISNLLLFLPFILIPFYERFPFYPLLLDDSTFFKRLFVIVAYFTLCIVIYFCVLVIFLTFPAFSSMKKFLTEHGIIAFFFSILSLPILLFFLFIFCNGFLDRSQLVEHTAVISSKNHKSSRRLSQRSISVKSWSQKNDSVSFKVNNDFFNSLNEGDTVQVFTKSGFFWLEWVYKISLSK